MTDRDALLRAILENPADDAPRLVYADWLDEHAGDVVCPHCDGFGKIPGPLNGSFCGHCKITGRIPNGNADRAAFIRVQVELAKTDPEVLSRVDWFDQRKAIYAKQGFYNKLKKASALRGRERELLAAGVVRPPVSGAVVCLPGHEPPAAHAGQYPLVAVVRRGFVAEVRAPLAALFGGWCGACEGQGAAWEEVSQGSVFRDCSACKGTGRTPGIAAALFAAHPVEAVRLTDREPLDVGYGWGWERGDPASSPSHLPDELWCENNGEPNDTRWVRANPHDCHAALSRAAVAYGRRLAGLPPLPVNQPGLGAVRPPA